MVSPSSSSWSTVKSVSEVEFIVGGYIVGGIAIGCNNLQQGLLGCAGLKIQRAFACADLLCRWLWGRFFFRESRS